MASNNNLLLLPKTIANSIALSIIALVGRFNLIVLLRHGNEVTDYIIRYYVGKGINSILANI